MVNKIISQQDVSGDDILKSLPVLILHPGKASVGVKVACTANFQTKLLCNVLGRLHCVCNFVLKSVSLLMHLHCVCVGGSPTAF